MGACQSNDSKEQTDKNKEIDREIKEEQQERKMKLLLLGAGESGKSTILKQMKILHDNGFSEEEVKQRKAAVYSNITTSMVAILKSMDELNIQLDSAEREADARILLDIVDVDEDSEPLTQESYTAVKNLWADKGVRECFTHKSEFQINDCAEYFFNEVDRIYRPDYRPTEKDILLTRVATMGIVEVTFRLKAFNFHIYDVGGQRSERRKWIHCFDDVNAIIFVTSLSEYDQVLREDSRTNRMQESHRLFEMICNNKWFLETSMILFLNKKDLFLEKVQQSSIKMAFPEYDGQQTYDACVLFIKEKFVSVNGNPEKEVYVHQTCATDSNQVQLVLDSVIDMCIEQALSTVGMQ